MAAEVTDDVIKAELESELKQVGFQNLSQTIKAEEVALKDLNLKKEEISQQIESELLKPMLARALKGYNVNGLFWENSQKKLSKIITREALIETEEKIDWLVTRNQLFKQMANNASKQTSDPAPSSNNLTA